MSCLLSYEELLAAWFLFFPPWLRRIYSFSLCSLLLNLFFFCSLCLFLSFEFRCFGIAFGFICLLTHIFSQNQYLALSAPSLPEQHMLDEDGSPISMSLSWDDSSEGTFWLRKLPPGLVRLSAPRKSEGTVVQEVSHVQCLPQSGKASFIAKHAPCLFRC